jgi:hypothetical protein
LLFSLAAAGYPPASHPTPKKNKKYDYLLKKVIQAETIVPYTDLYYT